MKVGNWCKNVAAALLAAGIWLPNVSYAANIPLGDASFEDFTVPSSFGYAYAAPLGSPKVNVGYRPTSAWVDDLSSPMGYTQDDKVSNWLYNSAYGESSAAHRRAAPRTGNQAMHGLFNYSAQVTSGVWEAGKTYTFSLWAQGDIDASGSSSRVFLYLFNGDNPFSQGTSLVFKRYGVDTGDFVNRPASASAAQSQAMWTKISLSRTVAPGAPEIGHHVGVAFWGADDGAVDDATLTVIPEPTSVILVGLSGVVLLARRRRE
jgi:hypothetical protein